jgi:hypothetical protein
VQDPATYTERFEREHGCTVDEWRMWLPGAVGEAPLAANGHHGATIGIGSDGSLHLQWQALPPRQIALIRMPRLQVRYRFERVGAQARAHFMRHFDLYMQRGGG